VCLEGEEGGEGRGGGEEEELGGSVVSCDKGARAAPGQPSSCSKVCVCGCAVCAVCA